MSTFQIWFDGLCEEVNPGGVMAWGWVIESDGCVMSGFDARPASPQNTNNIGEYFALGFALAAVAKLPDHPQRLIIRGDSQLVIKQLTGEWKCHKPHLADLRDRCLNILHGISNANSWWGAEWIPREQNGRADELSRKGYFKLTGRQAPERKKFAG